MAAQPPIAATRKVGRPGSRLDLSAYFFIFIELHMAMPLTDRARSCLKNRYCTKNECLVR